MRKFHWISMVLLAAPFAFANACGGDDTAPGGTAGTSAGSSGAGGDGTAGTSSTGGSSGSASTGGASGSASTGGSAGTGGSGTGDAAATDSGSAGSGSTDAAADTASGDDGTSTKCTNGNASGGDGKSCKDLCDGYFKVCKAHPGTTDTYANQAACVTACKALTQVQLCCRAQHAVTIAGNADASPADLDTHCPHVIGMSPCT